MAAVWRGGPGGRRAGSGTGSEHLGQAGDGRLWSGTEGGFLVSLPTGHRREKAVRAGGAGLLRGHPCSSPPNLGAVGMRHLPGTPCPMSSPHPGSREQISSRAGGAGGDKCSGCLRPGAWRGSGGEGAPRGAGQEPAGFGLCVWGPGAERQGCCVSSGAFVLKEGGGWVRGPGAQVLDASMVTAAAGWADVGWGSLC